MAAVRVAGLPDAPSAAANAFYQQIGALLASPSRGENLTLMFEAADHTHTGWRLAAIQSLAREQAPQRVNAIAGGHAAAVAAALAYLDAADGVTGQYLPLDDRGAGFVIQPPA